MGILRSLTIAILICAGGALAAPNPKLTTAKRLLDDLELDAAAKALNEAWTVPGNDRATVLEILELQGITWGTLGKSDRSREAFKQLLLLDPKRTLATNQPPRVRTPFYEAKDWAAKNGPLELASSVDRQPKSLTLTLKVKGDALNLARLVVVHLEQGSGVRNEQLKPDKTGAVTVKVQGEKVLWWAEVMGDRDMTLFNLGSMGQPIDESPAVAVIKTPDITPPPPPPPSVTTSSKWMRPTGIGMLVAGGVAGVVGGVVGYLSVDARNRIANAEKDANGVVIGMTQKDAAALDASAKSNAVTANVLFGAGAALAATGLVFTVVGSSSDVTVAPAPGGVTVSGHF